MRLYFTDSQVPEMAGLTPSQRRAVRREGYEMFCLEQPSRRKKVRVFNVFALFVGLAFAREFGHTSTALHTWWLGPLVVAATGFAIELPFQSVLTERLRPYCRRDLDEHGSGIR